jgi:hypothetical protein
MIPKEKLKNLVASATVTDQYKRQLQRITKRGEKTDKISETVDEVAKKLQTASKGSLVIYGEPQSGKTEMMICLTAHLLDIGEKTIIHLLNDSVDLLMQSLERFKLAGLAPAPRNAADLENSALTPGHKAILFCKKNRRDLEKLLQHLKHVGPVVVIDDEADYATPNAKINIKEKTKINALVSQLLGDNGKYIGVTATPARLNLNNTFNNKTETWVRFRPHDAYTGQDVFFPQSGELKYRLTLLPGVHNASDAKKALARFLVTVAYLNSVAISANLPEENYSFLVHTSGKTDDHTNDRKSIEKAVNALVHGVGKEFDDFLELLYAEACTLFPTNHTEQIMQYVLANASRNSFVVLNSKRDRTSAGDKPASPTCPFTVIIGGNIVSRGVTFPNLLSMLFTRDVRTKLQQDTYIQRARMFGTRGKYLQYFELTIPESLYADWHRCFVFHRLALQSITNNKSSPVWLGDSRISIAASSSIDRGTVDLNRGEMGFAVFKYENIAEIDTDILQDQRSIRTLEKLRNRIGEALPSYLLEYLKLAVGKDSRALAIHTSSSIAGYGASADTNAISRTRGFIGANQLESRKFPDAIHHIKIFYNEKGSARVFYKNLGGIQFMQNLVS